jgi:hypothetical protein
MKAISALLLALTIIAGIGIIVILSVQPQQLRQSHASASRAASPPTKHSPAARVFSLFDHANRVKLLRLNSG